MDAQMPVLDGLEATRQIRENERAEGRRRTPIIALTANAMSHQLAAYRDAGMDDVVAKPIEVGRLYAALEVGSGQRAGGGTSGRNRRHAPVARPQAASGISRRIAKSVGSRVDAAATWYPTIHAGPDCGHRPRPARAT